MQTRKLQTINAIRVAFVQGEFENRASPPICRRKLRNAVGRVKIERPQAVASGSIAPQRPVLMSRHTIPVKLILGLG